jgi:phosphate acyltransferase
MVSIDAMGGDAGPGVVVAALARCTIRHPDVRFLLHGDESLLKPLLAKRGKLATRTDIRHTTERVRMDEKPSQVLRRGRNTSMWRAIECVANKEAEVAISAGNTGALMATSMYQLGVLEGVDRPAIAALWPTKRGQSVVLDVGANVATDSEQLVEFAVMGEAFARAILGLERPTVGLLNVGAEDLKGNDAVRGAAHLLRGVSLPIEFCGFVEGDDIAEGTVDVIVTDGFTGNIALKTAEGTARLVVHFLRTALRRSIMAKIGAALASGALNTLRRKLDPRAANGGIFLGLNGVVVKSHGGTDALGFASALDMAIDMARAEVIPKIVADLAAIAPVKSAGAAAS